MLMTLNLPRKNEMCENLARVLENLGFGHVQNHKVRAKFKVGSDFLNSGFCASQKFKKHEPTFVKSWLRFWKTWVLCMFKITKSEPTFVKSWLRFLKTRVLCMCFVQQTRIPNGSPRSLALGRGFGYLPVSKSPGKHLK